MSSCDESQEGSWNQELEDILVEKLPVPVICLLRCVCKRWSLWPRGRHDENRVDSPNLMFICINYDRASIATYSPTLQRWYHLPLSNLQPAMEQLHLWKPRGDVYLVAADEGLLCFMVGFTTPQKDVKFVVVNPITNKWRQLPPFPSNRAMKPPLMCGMHVDKVTRTYKLILAGQILTFDDADGRLTHLYNSSTAQWTTGAELPRELFGVEKQCHFANGSFHYIDCCAKCIRTYDDFDGVWKKLLTTLPLFLCSPTLVKFRGNVAVVGVHHKTSRLHIMELDSSVGISGEWTNVGQVAPREPSLEAFLHAIVPGMQHTSLSCVGQENVIYVANPRSNVVAMFDGMTRRWSFVPLQPTKEFTNNPDLKGIFAATPTFTSVA